MKRFASRLAVFLLLGAMINVAVAWGCAMLINVASGTHDNVDEWGEHKPYTSYMADVWRTQGSERVNLVFQEYRTVGVRYPDGREVTFDPPVNRYEVEDLIPTWGFRVLHDLKSSAETDRAGAITPDGSYRTIDGRGWPFLSLWGGIQQPPRHIKSPRQVFRAIDLTPGPRNVFVEPEKLRLLPCSPIWNGFVLDSIVYAFALWLVLLVPTTVKRRARLHRRLCPACAYPIGASAICTECGKPVRPQEHWSVANGLQRLGLCIMLGFPFNIAVAWACSQFGTSFPTTLAYAVTAGTLHRRTMPDGARLHWEPFEERAFGVTIKGVPHDPAAQNVSIRYAVGWPCRCLFSSAAYIDDKWQEDRLAIKLRSTHKLFGIAIDHELPLQPDPLPFLLNSVFFGGVLWSGAFAHHYLIQRQRQRRLETVHCGVDGSRAT